MNLQDAFLNHVRLGQVPVSIFLSNGHQMKGMITGFDAFIILLESSDRDKQNLIYKHAISTIMPLTRVDFRPAQGAEPSRSGAADAGKGDKAP